MSTWRERLDERLGGNVATSWLVANYQYPTLALLAVFFLWTRTANWGRFVGRGVVFFRGNDPYYHLRSVRYVVEHWPATMPFDPWTNFPTGTSSAQFGTLFDQLIATGALLLGLGDPGEELIALSLLFAPVVFGVAILVPAYLIGKRLGGVFGGLVGAAMVAFATGGLFGQTIVGASDHHVAEALFQAVAVLGVMVAVSVAETERPVWELIEEREFRAIRSTVGWSLLAGVAIAAYLWVWPPGVLLLGILGVYLFVHLNAVFLRGRSPEHVAIAGAIALSTAGVFALATVDTLEVSATSRSLLQPGLAFAVAAGCAFMAWLARDWERRDLPTVGYPAAVAGLGLFLTVVVAVLAPSLFEFFVNNVLRVVGFETSPTAGTVAEAQPLRDAGRLYDYYKLGVIGAVAGGGLALGNYVFRDEPRGEWLLVVVWTAVIVAATFTQQRFGYYLTVPVAAMNALLVGEVLRFVRVGGGPTDVDGYQVLSVLTVVLLVLAPMVAFAPTAVGQAQNNRAGGGVVGWQPGLEWMNENTPVPGRYAAPDGEPMDYLGTYARTENFDYPAGAYGVLSWWDYGHWITSTAHRIPNANPFQQGATEAARFLLARNESRASDVLATQGEDDAKTRYVMIDWKMVETEFQVGGKFFAPAVFAEGVQGEDFYSRIVDGETLSRTRNPIRATRVLRHKQAYYESMVTRLYHYHGSAVEPSPVVLSWQGAEREYSPGRTYTVAPQGQGQEGRLVRRFRTVQAARNYVAEAPEVRQIGGIGTHPVERVPALEHYRLVHQSSISAIQSRGFYRARLRTVREGNLPSMLGLPSNRTGRQRALRWLFRTTPSWTKTFERVPGATIRGTGPANATVTARVTLQPSAGSPFQYVQQAKTGEDGSFAMTVPYATTGYDRWGLAEGYTNTSVRAEGPYSLSTPTTGSNGTFTTYSGTVNVTEGQVLGENGTASTVTLQATTFNLTRSDDGNGTTDGNATAGSNATDGTGDGGNATGSDDESGATGDAGSAESLADPGSAAATPARYAAEP